MFGLFYEYNNLEYVHMHVIYMVDQAEYVIRIRVAASQEYVNTYSTRRDARLQQSECVSRLRRGAQVHPVGHRHRDALELRRRVRHHHGLEPAHEALAAQEPRQL